MPGFSNMKARLPHSAGAAIAITLLTALAAPAFAAGGGGSSSSSNSSATYGAPSSPLIYPLQGDTSNFGIAQTSFQTAYGNIIQPSWSFSTSSATTGAIALRALCSSPACVSLRGDNGQVNGTAVSGVASAADGRGVFGEHQSFTGTGPGVRGDTWSEDASAVGVLGYVTSNTPGNFSAGVVGTNAGTGGEGIGVWGTQAGTGWGVYGSVTGAGVGVRGRAGANGLGVYGNATGTFGYGVYGFGQTGATGVYGLADSGNGVSGTSGSGNGVYGSSTGGNATGAAVYGANEALGDYAYGVVGGSQSSTGGHSAGVRAFSGAGGYGVYADSGATGVYGKGTAYGVIGESSDGGVALFGNNLGGGSGFYGYSANGPGGVMGSNATEGARFYTRNSSSYALVTGGLANTYGNAYITGRVTATGGCCSIAGTDSGNRQMYAEEATTSRFSDQGFGKLVNGRAVITIDPLYAETVNLSQPYHVFLTPRAFDTAGLAVGNLTSTSFEVREVGGGKGNFEFSWRIDAARKGYENDRMAQAPAPPSNTVPALPSYVRNTDTLPSQAPPPAPPTDQK